MREALERLDPLWDELFPAEQARIVRLLVERVDVGADRRRHPAADWQGWPAWSGTSARIGPDALRAAA